MFGILMGVRLLARCKLLRRGRTPYVSIELTGGECIPGKFVSGKLKWISEDPYDQCGIVLTERRLFVKSSRGARPVPLQFYRTRMSPSESRDLDIH